VGVQDLITLGENEGEVSLTFHSNGRKYRVLRKRGVRGRAESFFFQYDGGLEKLIAMRETEVTKEIEEVLGINGELFTNAVYIKQGEIDRLFTDDAALRKKHIGKLIGIEDIEAAYQNFFQLLNHYDLKIEKLESVAHELDGKKEKKKREKAEAKTLKSDLKVHESKLNSEKKSVQKLEERIGILEDLRHKVEEKKKISIELSYLKDKILKIYDFEEQLKVNEAGKNKADLVEEEIEDLKEKLNELKVIAERKIRLKSDLENEKNKRDSIEDELEIFLSNCSLILKSKLKDLSSVEKQRNKALLELGARMKALDGKKDTALNAMAEKKARVDSLKKSLAEIQEAKGVCPICARELKEDHRIDLIKTHSREIESLTGEFEKKQAEFENLSTDSKFLEKKRESINSLKVEVFREKNKQLEEVLERISRFEEKLREDEAALTDFSRLVEKIKSLKTELSSLLPLRDRYNAALNFLRREYGEKEKGESRIRDLELSVEGVERSLKSTAEKLNIDLNSLPGVYDGLRNDLKNSRQILIEIERRVAALRSGLEHKENRLEELENEISELEARALERKALMVFKALLERIRAIFHKDKLQKELRIRARPLIEEYAREVFLSFNLPYSDVTLTDDYSIKVHGANGEESVEMLSGGERIAAALALRIGLSRAIAGQRLELLILDEPTIHLDLQRRRELVDVIRNLSLIPQTIVVTHDKEFEEAADRVIEVEKVRGVSMVR
jgi:exonuclease SbcC